MKSCNIQIRYGESSTNEAQKGALNLPFQPTLYAQTSSLSMQHLPGQRVIMWEANSSECDQKLKKAEPILWV